MANTLTSLIPTLYSALDVVSRELVGMIPAVSRDATTERAAVGQTVIAFQTPTVTATDITPGVTPPNDGDQTINNVSLTITKAKRVPVRWNGEEQRGINANGPGFIPILRDQFAQGMRTLVNLMEVDLCALQSSFSRASGTAGTTPFASDLSDPANVRKILDDNGAPPNDRHLIINTTAGAKVRTLAQLTKANEAADTTLLRQGTLLDIHNFQMRESAQIVTSVAGTASGATTDTTGYAIGTTTIATAAAGTGTILAGDIVTFAGDTNKYVIATGNANVANVGSIVLEAPGLLVAMSAAAKAITVIAAAARNMAFVRSALILACRAPALPITGDMAEDRMLIQDPLSGLVFEISVYPQYRQVQYEIAMAWGTKNVKPQHTALLIG